MATYDLPVQTRDLADKPARLRREGFIPSTIYGPNITPHNIQVSQKAFFDFVKLGDLNRLISIALPGESTSLQVLLHQVQKHPVTDQFLNIEFYAVDLSKEVSVDIPIHLTGVSPAVKVYKGVLMHTLESLKARCLPANIVSEIVVDISVLDSFEKSIFVRDITIPEAITCLNSDDELVVKAIPSKKDSVKGTGEAADDDV